MPPPHYFTGPAAGLPSSLAAGTTPLCYLAFPNLFARTVQPHLAAVGTLLRLLPVHYQVGSVRFARLPGYTCRRTLPHTAHWLVLQFPLSTRPPVCGYRLHYSVPRTTDSPAIPQHAQVYVSWFAIGSGRIWSVSVAGHHMPYTFGFVLGFHCVPAYSPVLPVCGLFSWYGCLLQFTHYLGLFFYPPCCQPFPCCYSPPSHSHATYIPTCFAHTHTHTHTQTFTHGWLFVPVVFGSCPVLNILPRLLGLRTTRTSRTRSPFPRTRGTPSSHVRVPFGIPGLLVGLDCSGFIWFPKRLKHLPAHYCYPLPLPTPPVRYRMQRDALLPIRSCTFYAWFISPCPRFTVVLDRRTRTALRPAGRLIPAHFFPWCLAVGGSTTRLLYHPHTHCVPTCPARTRIFFCTPARAYTLPPRSVLPVRVRAAARPPPSRMPTARRVLPCATRTAAITVEHQAHDTFYSALNPNAYTTVHLPICWVRPSGRCLPSHATHSMTFTTGR